MLYCARSRVPAAATESTLGCPPRKTTQRRVAGFSCQVTNSDSAAIWSDAQLETHAAAVPAR
jgi:hypothetical protein